VRRAAAGLCALGLLVGGCGGSDSDSDSGGDPAVQGGELAATKFRACFKQPGYEAVRPATGEESLFALSAEKKGYEVVPVNVTKPGAVAANAFLAFFDTEENAAKAVDEVAVVGAGDVPPTQRGVAVVGYLDQASSDALGGAIQDCL
jgi:hypothetical protein